jgi:hypothetical protein
VVQFEQVDAEGAVVVEHGTTIITHGRFELRSIMSKPEIGDYLPQMGFTYDQILHRTLRCEQLGVDSLWLYDHLYGPGVPDYP